MGALDQRLEIPRRMIGRRRDELATPALILDLPVVERNITEMARRMEPLPAALRPHAKIHKSPELGSMQRQAGAIGLTTATIWEASALIDAGLADLLVANQVVGPVKAAEAARAASLANLVVAVESRKNARELSAAAASAGSEIGVLVEVDVGLHRAGVRSTDAAIELGREIELLPGLRLDGLLGYEGHCMLEPDRELRIEKAKVSNEILIASADAYDRHGLPTTVVAAGGLGTWDITGANPRITEIHAGSYVFMDAFHRNLVPGFEIALTVLATIVSRDGDLAVIDCGRKSIGIDRVVPEVVGGAAEIRFEHGEFFIHEEHTALTLVPGSGLDVGDRVELFPGYGPTTVNLYDIYFVVRDDIVVDVWPILGRYGSATSGVGPAIASG
jgi:D-serine deaminase-like pyridoxal phosphate-dependent protein